MEVVAPKEAILIDTDDAVAASLETDCCFGNSLTINRSGKQNWPRPGKSRARSSFFLAIRNFMVVAGHPSQFHSSGIKSGRGTFNVSTLPQEFVSFSVVQLDNPTARQHDVFKYRLVTTQIGLPSISKVV